MTWNDLIRRIRATAIWTRRSPAARAIKTWAEYLGKLAVVLGVLGFISERPERAKQRYYQAWQLINAAKQSLGDAGRRVAIRDLIDDHVEMRGIELNNSGFEGMDFRSAIMPNADFTQARLKDANFSCKAGFYINDYWVPAFRFCWPTVLDSAELATTISNDFTHASLHKTRLGPTLSTEQMEQLRTAQKIPDNVEKLSIHSSTFVAASMDEAVFRNVLIDESDFSYATLTKATFLNVNLGSGNSFAHADLRGSRFLSVTFLKEIHDDLSDLSDADLSDATFEWRTLTEADLPEFAVHLCHTRLPSGISDRDCQKSLEGAKWQ